MGLGYQSGSRPAGDAAARTDYCAAHVEAP